MNETASKEFDFEPAYRVTSYDGIAWRAYAFATEWEVLQDDEEGYYDMEYEDQSRVKCHMIGDDREFIFDVEDLTPLDEEEYCSGCGQIGCGWC